MATCLFVYVCAGFMYLILKHLVDKYNLHYARPSPHVDRQVHFGAAKYAMAAPIICLFWLYLFSARQAGTVHTLTRPAC